MNTVTPPLAPAQVLAQTDALMAAGRQLDAIELLRPLVGAQTVAQPIVVRFCYLLAGAGRAEEAIAAISPLAAAPTADIHVLSAYGEALKQAGRLDEAIAALERARQAAPTSGVAEHNLAAAYGDGHWFAEAEAATTRAMMKNVEAPETWLVRARALQGLGRVDDAERAFRQVLLRRPADPHAHAELAQSIWTRTEDAGLALRALDDARAASPADPGLARAKARFLESNGDRERAYGVFVDTLARPGADPLLNADAALVCCWLDPVRALAHAERAVQAGPTRGETLVALCQANLAAGRPREALALAETLRRLWPRDQFAIALMGMAWRLLGDPRYRALYDYDRLVRPHRLDTPAGWSSLSAYVADLDVSLRRLHTLRAQPIGQSVRNGTQTIQSLDRLDDPVIKAFFTAIDGPIRSYLDSLSEDGMALERPYAPGDGYRFDKVWSILLKPHGHHVNHLHHKGWVSTACHVGLPAAVERGRQGWLSFGEPFLPTAPHLPAEHFVKPEPGHLVLFPSYMWHGTVPFEGEETRLAAAFDVVPA